MGRLKKQIQKLQSAKDKFKAIIITKNGSDTSGIELKINEVTLLGVTLDYKLSCSPNI